MDKPMTLPPSAYAAALLPSPINLNSLFLVVISNKKIPTIKSPNPIAKYAKKFNNNPIQPLPFRYNYFIPDGKKYALLSVIGFPARSPIALGIPLIKKLPISR